MFYWFTLQGVDSLFLWGVAALLFPVLIEIVLTAVRYGTQSFASKYWISMLGLFVLGVLVFAVGAFFEASWAYEQLLRKNCQTCWILWPWVSLSSFFLFVLLSRQNSDRRARLVKSQKGICTRMPALVFLFSFLFAPWVDLVFIFVFWLAPLALALQGPKGHSVQYYIRSFLFAGPFVLLAQGFILGGLNQIWLFALCWFSFWWFAHRLFNAFMMEEKLRGFHP